MGECRLRPATICERAWWLMQAWGLEIAPGNINRQRNKSQYCRDVQMSKLPAASHITKPMRARVSHVNLGSIAVSLTPDEWDGNT